jgi:hypothetical protein
VGDHPAVASGGEFHGLRLGPHEHEGPLTGVVFGADEVGAPSIGQNVIGEDQAARRLGQSLPRQSHGAGDDGLDAAALEESMEPLVHRIGMFNHQESRHGFALIV